MEIYAVQALDLRKLIIEESCTTSEALEILGVSRARLNQMVKKGKLTPLKKSGAISIFFKQDLLDKKEELIELRAKYRPWEVE
ncbi:helix-turn-helix domain-containing protein [Cytobacillus sp. S13-E01]|uniref:helix-turn-helix domain-containing protein n=1 Tax=Cytobacillus sp. S13-E01 TaxID=3031326 RepID=UPI0023D88EB4|nr:helix-turn-helix domain-containing protein [Cytobacillus sp. S13-E01]MDF0727244.1 helix-turn-helix domain-containing protein [Cytobacillus sp. S13-E01]